jgi:cysteine synthase A
MKYRFTLSKKSNELALSVDLIKGDWVAVQVGYPITTQIIEDYTTPDYFYTNLIDILKPESFTDGNDRLALRWPFSDRLLEEIILKINTLASPERYGSTGNTYTDLIGRTPLLRLSRITDGCKATVLVKLESLEPNSVKDRTVFSIVTEAIKRGDITEDTEVIEASSGNVAFALSAILKAMLNKKPRIYISKMHGETKIRAVRVSGCPVVLTAASEGTQSAKRASVDYAKSHENIFQLNQHGNPDNPRAHRLTTGPEIYHQTHILTGQAPSEFVTGLGSGGTAVGMAMFRDDIGADFKVIGVEPEEASMNTGGEFKSHRFSGIAPGFITEIIKRNRDKIDHIETVSWREGFEVCRRMLIEEGMLVGATSGASIAVALRRARLPENEGRVIVTIAHDRGDRYMGMKDLFVPPPEATEVDLEGP